MPFLGKTCGRSCYHHYHIEALIGDKVGYFFPVNVSDFWKNFHDTMKCILEEKPLLRYCALLFRYRGDII